MTISALDSDPLFRSNGLMTSAATVPTPYLKEMPHHSACTHAAQAPAAATSDSHELELNFLSEFLLHEDFTSDPAALHGHGHGHGALGHDMKMEPMAAETSRVIQHFQFQQHHQQHLHIQQQLQSGAPPVGPAVAPNSPHSGSSSTGSVADVPEPLDRKAKRRQQVAISARRHRSRKKHELLDLRKEVAYMTSQLEFLRSKHKMMRPNGAVAEWEEKAMAQRRKRRQAESQNEELRRAMFLQGQFLNNLKSVFSASPMFTEDLNLRQLLHTYTRLGRNPRSRQRDYESICAQSKLQMATDILRRQTESIRFSTPFIKTQLIDSVDMFGATIVSVYAFDSLDVARVFRATCNAIKDSSNTWPEFQDMDGQRKIVDAVPTNNIIYGKQTTTYKTEQPESSKTCESTEANSTELIVETRVISFWHVTEHEAVLVWDFVDDDDLHPIREDCDFKRDMVGAVLVRRELCEDGKERVVCRSICSKLHSKREPAKAKGDSAIVDKFSTSPSRSLTRMCGNVVLKSIQEAVAQLSV